MAVTRDDVRHVAALARLAITDQRADEFTAQLNAILGHMDVLARIDTKDLEPMVGIGADAAPLRPDAGPPASLERPIETIAPSMRDGFFIVPRLSTHESAEES
jgi:aspartyl-tRNA(Asn)/glutamyl-tRNA(Gln) amidotransferase subunit C